MDSTQFLASLWGPVALAVGVGMFTSKGFYARIYRELEKDALAALTLGLAAMAAGIAQVISHNVWNTLPQIVISILGWGTLLKGLMFVAAPQWAGSLANSWSRWNMIPVASVICLILGAYLTWFAFLA
ncbi:MAG: hypothetical protein JO019_03870 [Candidatus Kaiserbacteria bacterium]|nr:hypothetical protein [Candidatus Kaiserbacteria bacterium]